MQTTPTLTACLLSLCLAAAPAEAAPAPPAANPPAASAIGNLGDSLLDGDLAKALSPTPGVAEQERPNGDWLPDDEMLRRLLQKETGPPAGEDVGRGESPLASVIRGMRQAEGLIADESGEAAAAPVQRQVVTQLEKLIAQMEKQCQGGQCNKPGEKKKQVSKRSQPKKGQPKPGECDKEGDCDKPGKPSKKAGKKANQSGTTSLAGAPNASPAEQQELMKAAWGHLPERMRERMLQGSDNEFLPEYRDELQEYYRRLAERSTRTGSPRESRESP